MLAYVTFPRLVLGWVCVYVSFSASVLYIYFIYKLYIDGICSIYVFY